MTLAEMSRAEKVYRRFNNSIFDHNKQTSFKINFIKGDKAKKTITFLGQN